MIVLDTNVISALMQDTPEPIVVGWLDRQPPESIWTTSVCVFEIRYGLALLPAGRKRRVLETAFERMWQDDLQRRVLTLDVTAAGEAAELSARLRTAGRGVDIRDVLIAGIVASRRAALATRNTCHFAGTGIGLVDPWRD